MHNRLKKICNKNLIAVLYAFDLLLFVEKQHNILILEYLFRKRTKFAPKYIKAEFVNRLFLTNPAYIKYLIDLELLFFVSGNVNYTYPFHNILIAKIILID